MKTEIDYNANSSISNSATFSAQNPIPAQRDLDSLAATINAAHADAQAHAATAVERALVAGNLLNKVKAQLKHGEFLPWCKAHCPAINHRTLQSYMRVARELPVEMRSTSHLSVREALRLVSGDAEDHAAQPDLLTPAAPAPAPEPKRPWWKIQENERNAQTCRMWPDLLHAAVLYLDTDGQSPDTIAATLGLDVREVMAVLEPQLPREWHSGNEMDAYILRRARSFLTGWRRTALRTAATWANDGCRPALVQELTALANAAERDYRRVNGKPNPKYYLGAIEMLAADAARAALVLCPPINLYLDMVVECHHNTVLMQLPPGFFDDPAYHEGIKARRIPDDQLGRVTLDEILENQRLVQDFERQWIDEKRRSMEATS